MRCGSILPAILLSLCSAGVFAQRQTVAHVLDVTGAWRLDGAAAGTAAPIVAGTGLAAGAKIDAVSGRPGDAITLVRDEDMSRQRVVCDATTSNPCHTPIVVAAGASSAPTVGSQLKAMVGAALSVLLDKGPSTGSNYAMTLSRGADTVRRSEAVVALDAAGNIQLPDPPTDMPAATYTVSVARAGETTSISKQALVLTSEGTWRPLPLGKPGLYEVSIANADEEQVADVMLLVTAPADYPAKRSAFDTMKSRADLWSGPGAQDDEHLFLRALLLSGSQPLSGIQP